MATILVVDDSPKNREQLIIPLRNQGHRLLEASDGAEALALARTEPPDLIIGDAKLPMIDRSELVRHLRCDHELKVTRVVCYTGHHSESESIALVQGPSVSVVLPKPSDPQEIIRSVNLALGQTASPAEELGPEAREELDRQRPRLAANEVDATGRQQAGEPPDPTLARRQAMFDNAPDAILLGNDETRFVDANPAACQLLGYSRDELLQMNLFAITPEQNRPRAAREWQRFIEAGKLWGEYTVIRKDGIRREIEYHAVANALPGLHLSIVRDITQRKRAESELKHSEERFRQLTEHVDDVFWISDPANTQIFYVSPAYERIWGRTCESLYMSPQSWSGAIHPADRDQIVKSRALQRATGTHDLTYRIVRPDGSIRWIRARAYPVCNASGEIIRVAGTAEDVTDLKRAEEELRHYSQRLEAMSEIDCAILMARSSQEIAHAVLSRTGRLVPCKLTCVFTFDFEADQVRILSSGAGSDSELSPGNIRPIDVLGDIQDLRNGQVRVFEDLLATPNQSPLAAMLLAEKVRSYMVLPILARNELMAALIVGAEKPAAFTPEHVEMAGEITARFAVALRQARLFEQVREGQQRLKRLSLQLMQAHEEERRHIARELHDEIGQALTATKVNLQALQQPAKEDAAATLVHDTMAIIDNTLRQVRELSLDLRPSMLDDLGLAAAVRGYLDRQSQRSGFSTDFVLDAIAAAPRVSPEIEIACFRVVQEGLTNIIRHAGAHHVRVELRQSEAELQLLIHDDGIGFDVPAAQRRAVHGATFGLLGLQERVALLGGQIEIKSAPSQGTEIRACFPVRAMEPPAAAEP